LKTLPLDSSGHKLSNDILFAKFAFMNLREFEFEVAVIKQLLKGFSEKKMLTDWNSKRAGKPESGRPS
jgi:hypothetical protein